MSEGGYDPFEDVEALEREVLGREPLRSRIAPASVVWRTEDTVSEELLGPLCVRGHRIVIGGHTGAGKSTLNLAMGKAIAAGSEFLGWRGSGGKVLVVDLEQGLRTVKRRLGEAGLQDADNVDILRVPEGLSLDRDERERNELEAIVRSGVYDLVTLDPLYKAHAGDSNEERAMVDLMRVLDGWRADYGFCLAIPMHMRKPPAQGGTLSMHDIFGSSGLVRGAEVVVGIEFVSPGVSRLHFWKDRDGDLPVGEKWLLTFSRDCGYTRMPERQSAADRLRWELSEAPFLLTADELADRLGITERTVRRALKEIDAQFREGTHGRRIWALADADEDSAETLWEEA